MPEFRLTTNFDPDSGDQTSCEVYVRRDGKLFVTVCIDYAQDVNKIAYRVERGIEVLTHQEIAQMIYQASCYIDSILFDGSNPPPQFDQQTGEWKFHHPTEKDPGPLPPTFTM